jgi:Tol biopolymer transport system component
VIGSLLAACGGGNRSSTSSNAASYLPPVLRITQSLAGINGRIAFAQYPPDAAGPDADIYTINPDGTHIRRLTHLAARGDGAGAPHWSPDSKHLIFTWCTGGCNNRETTTQKIGIVNPDGTGLRVLYNETGVNVQNQSFSPDGKHIVFSRCVLAFGSCFIARLNADGTGLVTLTHANPIGLTIDLNPTYSPDGRAIAFDGFFRAGYLERLYVMSADGAGMRPISPASLGANKADWAPNGGRLAFSTHPNFAGFGANEEIWSGSYEGGVLADFVQLTHNNDDHLLPTLQANNDIFPAWSPRGDAIVFERDHPDGTTSLELLKCNGSGLERTLLTVPRRSAPILKIRTLQHHMQLSSPVPHARLFESGGMSPSWGSAPPIQ